MLNPSDFFIKEPSYRYYSYQEGISICMKIITIALVFALISMIISLIIGIRRKDCASILVGNIMVKTVAFLLYKILDNLLNLNNFFIILLFFIASVIIEGFIYKKVLKYKKHTGMTVSVICNIVTVIIMIITGFSRLLNSLF